MKKMLLILCLILLGCTSEGKEMVYSISELTNIKYTLSEDKIDLEYQAPLETLYYSPGVDYKVSDDGKLEIKVVRCKFKEDCEVKAKAEQGDFNKVTVQLTRPFNANEVIITDNTSRVVLSELDN